VGGRGTLHGVTSIPFIEYEVVQGGTTRRSFRVHPRGPNEACQTFGEIDATHIGQMRVGDAIQAFLPPEEDGYMALHPATAPYAAWHWFSLFAMACMTLGAAAQLVVCMVSLVTSKVWGRLPERSQDDR
jgi:hypothetical protein